MFRLLPSVFAVSLLAAGAAAAAPAPSRTAPPSVPRPPRVVALQLDPPVVVLDRPGTARQLLVTGRAADGSLRDLTGAARYTSARPGIAAVDRQGVATPRRDGETAIVVRVGALEAHGKLVVRGALREPDRGFAELVAPVLTSAGCNNGNCHGSPVGKGGFKLSLFGYYPDQDYRAIARDGEGRRIHRQDPAASLLLRKATMQVAHQGGLRFRPGSREYRMLESWLRAGAPEALPGAAPVTGLEVQPQGRILTVPGQTQRLVVLARYADGTTADVTGFSVFSSGDDAVAQVSPAGIATAAGLGETAVMVRYGGRVSVSVVGATPQPPVRDFPYVPAENVVDRYVFPRLRALHIPPAPTCTDAEFLRRAHLDLVATLPTVEEVRAFLRECETERGPERAGGPTPPAVLSRRRLIDRLLERPEYADLQALLWADRLRSNSRFHRVGGVRMYQKWLKESFLGNMPLDRFARQLVTARGQNYSDGPSNFWGNYDVISRPDELAPQASQLFLGVRLHCAQCHNHPFERWTQNDFYSLAAVFGQVKGRGTKQTQEFELYLDPKATVENPDTKQVMAPHALDSPVFAPGPEGDVRLPFADWLTAPENPYFGRAMVNRLWKQMMGRGLVEPVDDFRVTNPPTHPELLDALARELVTHHFDQKHVLRLIAGSRAYQAASQAAPGNAADRKYYSRAYPKRLMSEVYFDAVCQVTGKPEEFKNWPEAKRAVQLPENRYPSYFLDTFSRGNRLVICERQEEGTMAQALNLVNGREFHDRVNAKDGVLAKHLAAGMDDAALLEELFLATLSRGSTPEERRRLARQLAAAPSREEGYQDLLWALLSCREFQFNH